MQHQLTLTVSSRKEAWFLVGKIFPDGFKATEEIITSPYPVFLGIREINDEMSGIITDMGDVLALNLDTDLIKIKVVNSATETNMNHDELVED